MQVVVIALADFIKLSLNVVQRIGINFG